MTFNGDDMPRFMLAEKLCEDKMPAGKSTCNAMRRSRDAYCQSPGVAEFARCPSHGGNNEAALDIFKKAIPLEQAQKLEILINDTLSMDNELGSGKTLLVQEIDTFYRMEHYINEFMDNLPQRPMPDAEDFENELKVYNIAVAFHEDMLGMASKRKTQSFRNATNLIKILNDGISKNSKMKEGSKFQLDVKQISKLLKVQLEAHQVCAGCPKLKKVIEYIKEHTRDIPLNPNMNKNVKEAVGKRAYQEMINEVNNRMEDERPKDTEFDIES